jgi:DNA-binding beta-propeller fold protein YncE
MSLKLLKTIPLPAHQGKGGFDHASYYIKGRLMYVAHTANDAIDIIDCVSDSLIQTIPNLKGVAGALVSNERDLVFSSNRGEDAVAIFKTGANPLVEVLKLKTGVRPNGLAFDPSRNLLLSANVGNVADAETHTLTIFNTQALEHVATIQVPGRTRWTVFNPISAKFFVNIGEPAVIVTISALNPTCIETILEIPSIGPHGLDIDVKADRLFCACDSGELVVLDATTGRVNKKIALSGAPDVIFLNSALEHLYVAVGDPGVIDIFDTRSLTLVDHVKTEKGAHTIGFASDQNKVYAFLPESCQAAVFEDVNERL